MPEFTIIIPNWNGERFLEACIGSVFSQKFPGDIEVIVVDNYSQDNSLELVKRLFPQVVLIELPRNQGFATAVNAGIKAAKAPLIVLLNNDTEVESTWLDALNLAAHTHPEASFFASKLINYTIRTIIDSCGDGMSWSGRPYKSGEGKLDGPEFSIEKMVFGAGAAASMYRSEFFQKVGLFDEDFTTYLEDVDVNFRAQLAGLHCLFVPDARVYHIGSATSGKGSAFSFEMMIKNHFHLLYKNIPTSKLRTIWGKLFYSEARFILSACRSGLFGNYLRGAFRAVREHHLMRPKRLQIQNSRIVTNAELDLIIDPNFKYKSLREVHRG